MTATAAKPARRARAKTEAPREQRASRRRTSSNPSGLDPAVPLEAGAATPPASKAPGGKLGVIVALMRRPEGATVARMGEATGWQPHSVRGALAGALKKTHGLVINGEAGEGGRVYRIAAADAG